MYMSKISNAFFFIFQKLEVERQIPDMEFNPFLAKAFASAAHMKK